MDAFCGVYPYCTLFGVLTLLNNVDPSDTMPQKTFIHN